MSDPLEKPEKAKDTIKDTKEVPAITPASADGSTAKPPAANSNEPAEEKAESTVETPEAVTPPPASESSAPVSNDNTATPSAPAPAAEATKNYVPPKASRKHKILSIAFNMAAGAVVTGAAKMAVVSLMTWAAAPAIATLLVSSLAVGAASTAFCHFGQARAAKKQGLQGPKFWSKQNAKIFAKSSTFALVGGALFLGFHEGIIQNWWHNLTHHATPPAPVPAAVAPVVAPDPAPAAAAPPAPVVAAPPVETAVQPPVVAPVVHCATPLERFTDLVKDQHVSNEVQNALHRAASTNAHIAAQGTKDLAFYAQNGLGGVPKDPNVAVELFKQAADAGNVQARVDMLYLQHHGLDGIVQNKAASVSAMKDIAHNARAGEFVRAWGGAGKTLPHVDFDTNAILKGATAKIGCPA